MTEPVASMSIEAAETAPKYAGFWIRVLAAIIDGLLMAAVSWLISRGKSADSMFSGVNFVSAIIGWLYYSLMESSAKQATLGKMVVGIYVTDESGKRISFARATGRYFAKVLSAVILLIGFIMVAFTQKKQGLHDMLADTLVVKVN
jgi:uncharacterized RDD family membrane protein YckC